jgi:hypothetical protein
MSGLANAMSRSQAFGWFDKESEVAFEWDGWECSPLLDTTFGGISAYFSASPAERPIRPVAGEMPVGPTGSGPDWRETPVLLGTVVA